MVSWVNIWLAGIETVWFPFNIYRRENSLPSKPVLHRISESFPPIQSQEKKKSCFSHGESLWVQEPLFVSIITHYKFRMCVGSAIPISPFHRQMMTGLLSRVPAEGNTQSQREWEDPGGTAASWVFFPSLTVRWAAVQGGGHLLEGED